MVVGFHSFEEVLSRKLDVFLSLRCVRGVVARLRTFLIPVSNLKIAVIILQSLLIILLLVVGIGKVEEGTGIFGILLRFGM